MPAYKLQGQTEFQGLDIAIENKKGSVRRWFDPHGKEKGSTKMHFSYGYIRGTKGTDGDHVDVYVGPDTEAKMAYIVDQAKKPDGEIQKDGKAWTKFDEQKVMLGFPNAKAAKDAYLKQYDDPRFFLSMRAMPMEQFKEKVLDKSNHGKKVAVALDQEWDEEVWDEPLYQPGKRKRKLSSTFLDWPEDPRHVPPTQRKKKMKTSSFDPIDFAEDEGRLLAQDYWATKTAMEKQAIINMLARGVGKAVGRTGAAKAALGAGASKAKGGLAKKVQQGVQGVKGGVQGVKARASNAAAGVRNSFQAGRSAGRGVAPAARGGGAMPKPQVTVRNTGKAAPATAATGTTPYRKAPVNVGPASVPANVPTAATPVAQAGAQAAPGKKLLSGGNVLKAGLIGTGGLALYGGMKGIDGAAGLAERGQAPNPYVASRVPGIGRPY